MGDRKSPYLILGVPYGASKNEAARAFALATRRLRRQTDAPYDLEDLNWALHAVEQRIQDPATSIDDFRMPADPSAYELSSGEGILNPAITPYRRRSPESDTTDLDALRDAVLIELAAEIAAECQRSELPALHSFPRDSGSADSSSSTNGDTLKPAPSLSAPPSHVEPSRRRTLGWVVALLVVFAVVIATVIGLISANSADPSVPLEPSNPPMSVTPGPDDTAAMAFDAQFATDQTAYEACDYSCWIWDVTPSASCDDAEFEVAFFATEASLEPVSSRTLPIGQVAEGVVTRIVVPAESDDPEYAAPQRLACMAKQ